MEKKQIKTKDKNFKKNPQQFSRDILINQNL